MTLSFVIGFGACAQTGEPVQAHHPAPAMSPSHSAERAAVPTAEVPVAESSSDTAAKPPTVVLKEGKLTITTDNSDLTRILFDVSKLSGMNVDGNVKSIRVFGVYGPGNPGDVLTDLLAGAGYNFIMVGKLSDGAPRALLLSEKSGGGASPAGSRSMAAASSNDDDKSAPDEEPPGPGAIPLVPPTGSQDPQERMQQNLQRLQQQREQMQQQQQNSPQ